MTCSMLTRACNFVVFTYNLTARSASAYALRFEFRSRVFLTPKSSFGPRREHVRTEQHPDRLPYVATRAPK